VKTKSRRLCHRETPEDCHNCFEDRSAEDFWLRKRRYQWYFGLIDQFVAPSEFLRQRYVAWGIEPARIVTIENGQADRVPPPPRALTHGGTRNRFGFFGQINPFKGLQVVLRGLAALPPEDRSRIALEIHGVNLDQQNAAFQEEIDALRQELEREGVIQWMGPYDPAQLSERMARVDWVVVPSIWWENSPMVIQEAFTLGRPVVCSGIGGMAEKVEDGVNGVHVPAAHPKAWAETLLWLGAQTEEWDRLRAGISRPPSYAECARAHLQLLDRFEKRVA